MAPETEKAVTQKALLQKTVDAAGKVFKRSAAIEKIRKDAEQRLQSEGLFEAEKSKGRTAPES